MHQNNENGRARLQNALTNGNGQKEKSFGIFYSIHEQHNGATLTALLNSHRSELLQPLPRLPVREPDYAPVCGAVVPDEVGGPASAQRTHAALGAPHLGGTAAAAASAPPLRRQHRPDLGGVVDAAEVQPKLPHQVSDDALLGRWAQEAPHGRRRPTFLLGRTGGLLLLRPDPLPLRYFHYLWHQELLLLLLAASPDLPLVLLPLVSRHGRNQSLKKIPQCDRAHSS